MRRCGIVATFCATLAALTSAAAQGAQGGVQIRRVQLTDYPLVRLTVVMRDTRHRPHVLENGRAASAVVAQNLGRNKAIVIAVDRSQSMRGQPLTDATTAVAGFIDKKPQQDSVAVEEFGWKALMLTPSFSQATIDSDTALRTLSSDDHVGTALYDGIVLAATELRGQPLAGRVLVLLTDGRDLGSLATLRDAIRSVQQANVIVYPIALGRADKAPLERLASESGGALYTAPSPATLADVYRRIGSELRRTWRVEFPTSVRPGTTDNLRIVAVGATGTALVRMPGSATSPPSVALRSLVDSRWGVTVVTISAFFLVLLGAWLALRRPRGGDLRELIMAHSAAPQPLANDRSQRPAIPRPRALFTATESTLGSLGWWRRASLLVMRSGTRLRVVEIFYLSIAIGAVLGILAAAAGAPVVIVAVAVLLGMAVMPAVVQLKAASRLRAFDAQLPDHLSTLAASLKVGHSLRHAFATLAAETAEPSRSEFARVVSQTRIGMPLETALTEMAQRVGSDDLDYIVTAIAVQTQVGGSLASLIDMVSETVRHRQQHARKVRSLTAMGRLSAYMLVALPFLLAVLITLVNRPYLAPLFHRAVGHALIAYSLVSMTVGSLLLKKIVAIKG